MIVENCHERHILCDLCSKYDTDLYDLEYEMTGSLINVHPVKDYPVPKGYKIAPRYWTAKERIDYHEKQGDIVWDCNEGTKCSMSDWNKLEHICEECFDYYFTLNLKSTQALVKKFERWK